MLNKLLTHYKPFKGRINMKNIAFLNVALMATGCSQPIQMCFEHYPDKLARENCINTRINEMLPQGYSYQGHLTSDNIKKDNVSKTPTVSNRDFNVQIGAFKEQSLAEIYVQKINTNTRIRYNVKVSKGTNKEYPYIVLVEVFNSSYEDAMKFIDEMKKGEFPDAFIVKDSENLAIIKYETEEAQDIKEGKIYEEDSISVEINLNTMCNDLKVVWDKFINEKRSPQAIDKVKRDFEACQKDKSDLRKLQ